MISNDFAEVMQNKTDEQLAEILRKYKEDYQPEAIVAAEVEVKRRNIDIDVVYSSVKESNVLERDNEEVVILVPNVGMRFVHIIIDGMAFMFLLGFISVLFPFFGGSRTESWILFLMIFFLYYTVMELNWQTTLGKLLTSSKVVVLETGDRPDLRMVLTRTAVRLVPFAPLIYLFTGCAMHDRWSGTIVIREIKKD